MIHETDRHNDEYTATYCPEDNKLRLYTGRVERCTYEELVRAGYKSTPKQSCDFVATWSIDAEDIAFELIPEDRDIEDEDYSPEERAADRAERFAGYRDKRRGEAGTHADRYDAGPQAFGNQSAARAERSAARHDRHRDRSLCQWSKAEYWQHRTAGVISHALHRSSPSVRRGRILEIERLLRGCYDQSSRYAEHLRNRLIYENAMLENEGGKASEVEIVPGGFLGDHQIYKVNRSNVTGRVVSVKIRGGWGFIRVNGQRLYCDHADANGLANVNIERCGESVYRAPTQEELDEFNNAQKTSKATRKATAPKAPTLYNPTEETAQQLADIMNAGRGEDSRVAVCKMTQAAYSALSRGEYGPCKTADITDRGLRYTANYNGIQWNGSCVVFKIRINTRGYHYGFGIVVLTDKPQKPLPINLLTETGPNPPGRQAAIETLPMLNEASKGKSWFGDMPEDVRELWKIAASWGFTRYESEIQFGITEAGRAALAAQAEPAPIGSLF